jgi:hypothetical protein
MYNSQHTQIAIECLEKATEYLKWLDKSNKVMSGNGKDSILECEARIASSEPDNPLYPTAAGEMFCLSFCLHEMRNELLDVMDIIYGTAKHFKVYDVNEGEWFHDSNEIAEKHFMDTFDLQRLP